MKKALNYLKNEKDNIFLFILTFILIEWSIKLEINYKFENAVNFLLDKDIKNLIIYTSLFVIFSLFFHLKKIVFLKSLSPNFVFIFSMDMSQLTPSIKKVYGEIEVDKYFRKFFDLVFHLPTLKVDKYFDFLFTSNQLSNIINSDYISVIREVIVFHDNLSLRECEKIFNIIRISHFSIKEWKEWYFQAYIIPYLILLKVLLPQEYSNCKAGKKDWDFDLINKWILEKQKIDEVTKNDIQEIFSILGKNNYNDRSAELIKSGKSSYEYRQFLKKGLSDFVNDTLEFSELFKEEWRINAK